MKIFAIVILLISSAALLTSLYSLRMLKKMDMLNKEYWKQKGGKNAFAYLLWISLWLGSMGLLLEQSWGKLLIEIGLVMFLVMVLAIGITQIIGSLGLLGTFGKSENNNDESENDTQEYVEEEEEFDPLKKHVYQKVVVSLVMTILISALTIWALAFLR